MMLYKFVGEQHLLNGSYESGLLCIGLIFFTTLRDRWYHSILQRSKQTCNTVTWNYCFKMVEPYHATNHKGIWFLISYIEIVKNIVKPKLLNYLQHKFYTSLDFKGGFWKKLMIDFSILYFLKNTLFLAQRLSRYKSL